MRVILASASPRRRELLGMLIDDFLIIPAEGEERCAQPAPADMVMELADGKALEVRDRYLAAERANSAVGRFEPTAAQVNPADERTSPAGGQDYLVIGADTVVACEEAALGKPADEEAAKAMLRLLSGRTHQVYTGVALYGCLGGKLYQQRFYERTDVTFAKLDEREIDDYVATGEPMDKAGSYGIQGLGGRFVTSIVGDYNNVVGLPVARLYRQLLQFSPGLCTCCKVRKNT